MWLWVETALEFPSASLIKEIPNSRLLLFLISFDGSHNPSYKRNPLISYPKHIA